MAVEEFDHHSREVMLAFYRRLYPFKSIYRWLNHEHVPTRLFTHREIAYSLPGDIYIRYKSFSGPDDFKKETLSYNPERFEIGPVYSAKVWSECLAFYLALLPDVSFNSRKTGKLWQVLSWSLKNASWCSISI